MPRGQRSPIRIGALALFATLTLLAVACGSAGGPKAAPENDRDRPTGAAPAGTDRDQDKESDGHQERHRHGGRTLRDNVHHDTSAPLRSVTPKPPREGSGEE